MTKPTKAINTRRAPSGAARKDSSDAILKEMQIQKALLYGEYTGDDNFPQSSKHVPTEKLKVRFDFSDKEVGSTEGTDAEKARKNSMFSNYSKVTANSATSTPNKKGCLKMGNGNKCVSAKLQNEQSKFKKMNTKKYQFPRREEEGVSLPKIEGMQDITDSHSKQLYIGNL
jgi:hypothetical protein